GLRTRLHPVTDRNDLDEGTEIALGGGDDGDPPEALGRKRLEERTVRALEGENDGIDPGLLERPCSATVELALPGLHAVAENGETPPFRGACGGHEHRGQRREKP